MKENVDVHFAEALSDICMSWPALTPPKRVTVSQGAADVLMIKPPGGAAGPWSADETPYMVEPMNALASRGHEAVCFVGPARTGKTVGLIDGWMAHNVINDPGDMLIIQMSQEKAREFSRTRIDRAIRNSPKLAAMLGRSAQDDNTHDKAFRNGMWLRIGWPTVSQLSSSDYRYVAMTDYDRVEDDIGGEGTLFDLGRKRTTTFLSRGMSVVESSPGREIQTPHWSPVTPHEAPPVGGILGIYNRSDRRRWYWKCLDCREWYEAKPGLDLFHLPKEDELLEIVREADLTSVAKKYARVVCPHCGTLTDFKHRHDLNRNSRDMGWIPDGQYRTKDDELVGTAMTSTIAGFWLGGAPAVYQKWQSLIERYLQGLREYTLTGVELTLKSTITTDQGMPYMSRHLKESQRDTMGVGKPVEVLPRYIVPDAARLVIASVDVQGGNNARFVVQVHAIGPHKEEWLINRFNIIDSRREGMGTAYAPLDPASYIEDWDRITEEVVRASYKTTTVGRELRVKLTVVDSGGEDGVTDKAYAWMRKLRKAGLGARVMLYKGASTKSAPLIRESLVGARNAKEKGDVSLYVCNPNLLADAVSACMKRTDPGPGYYHFPEAKSEINKEGWLPKAFFDELTAEVRDPNGTWRQIRKRNESFDLCKMIYAGYLRLGLNKFDKSDAWDNVPTWAKPLDQNSEIITSDARRAAKSVIQGAIKTEAIVPRVVSHGRRIAPSPYLN